jgi:hypothetical protein
VERMRHCNAKNKMAAAIFKTQPVGLTADRRRNRFALDQIESGRC